MEIAEDSGNSRESVSGPDVVVALRDYMKSAEKPWETDMRKGDIMKLVDSTNKDWWVVEIDNRQKYVPAEYLSKAKPIYPMTIIKCNLGSLVDGRGSDTSQLDATQKSAVIRKRNLDKSSEGICDTKAARLKGGSVKALRIEGSCSDAVKKNVESKSGPSPGDTPLNLLSDLVSRDCEMQTVTIQEDFILEKSPSVTMTTPTEVNLESLQPPVPVPSTVLVGGPVAEVIVLNSSISSPSAGPSNLSPVQTVLTSQKLLTAILIHLRHNVKTLQSVRLVNSLWKKCAHSAFRYNPSLLPTIVFRRDSRYCNAAPWWVDKVSSLAMFLRAVKPSSGFPLKVLINCITKNGINFLKRYAGDINYIHLDCSDLHNVHKFTTETGVPPLPALEIASFKGITTGIEQYSQIDNAFLMWKTLIGEGKTLRYYIESWRELSGTGLPVISLLERISENQQLSQLQKVILTLPSRTPRPTFNFPLRFIKGEKITELTFSDSRDFYLGPMQNLKRLKLVDGATVSVSGSVSESLPNLVKVTLIDPFNKESEEIPFTSNSLLDNVLEMEVIEHQVSDPLTTQQVEREFDKVVARFPNLTKLQWRSRKSLKRLATVARIIFANLEHLCTLEMEVEDGDVAGLVKLLTGNLRSEIPIEKEFWPYFLEEERGAVCNLKNLSALKITFGSKPDKKVCVPFFESEFLFDAVFMRMEALRTITLKNLRLGFNATEETVCVRGWRQSGRIISFL